MKKLTIYLILSLLVFGGCEKDKTEPEETTPTKEELLCREWKLEKEFVNGIENQDMLYRIYEFQKNGSLAVKIGAEPIAIIEMEWEWTENKEGVMIKRIDESKTSVNNHGNINHHSLIFSTKEWREYQIKQLTAKDLILEYSAGNSDIRIELIGE